MQVDGKIHLPSSGQLPNAGSGVFPAETKIKIRIGGRKLLHFLNIQGVTEKSASLL